MDFQIGWRIKEENRVILTAEIDLKVALRLCNLIPSPVCPCHIVAIGKPQRFHIGKLIDAITAINAIFNAVTHITCSDVVLATDACEHERIHPIAAVDLVVSRPTRDGVVTGSSSDEIVACTTNDHVVATHAAEGCIHIGDARAIHPPHDQGLP